jgi:hypothetical protein
LAVFETLIYRFKKKCRSEIKEGIITDNYSNKKINTIILRYLKAAARAKLYLS